MVYIHIVLVKVKPLVLTNGYEEFKARLETLRDLQVTKDEVAQLKWGPPVWDTRAHGFDYGLYTVFHTREGLERYKDDAEHKEYVAKHGLPRFSKTNLIPNVDGMCLCFSLDTTNPLSRRACVRFRTIAHRYGAPPKRRGHVAALPPRRGAYEQALDQYQRCAAPARGAGVRANFVRIQQHPERRASAASKHELAHPCEYVSQAHPDVNRGYPGGTPPGIATAQPRALFSNAQDTIHDVKSSSYAWGRTATMPSGVLRGTAPASDFGPTAQASLKRGMGEEDSDAILANVFDEDNGRPAPFAGTWAPDDTSFEEDPVIAKGSHDRTVRPLPTRGGFRPTQSMPPLRELPQDFVSGPDLSHTFVTTETEAPADTMLVEQEPFRAVDFATYAMRSDGF